MTKDQLIQENKDLILNCMYVMLYKNKSYYKLRECLNYENLNKVFKALTVKNIQIIINEMKKNYYGAINFDFISIDQPLKMLLILSKCENINSTFNFNILEYVFKYEFDKDLDLGLAFRYKLYVDELYEKHLPFLLGKKSIENLELLVELSKSKFRYLLSDKAFTSLTDILRFIHLDFVMSKLTYLITPNVKDFILKKFKEKCNTEYVGCLNVCKEFNVKVTENIWYFNEFTLRTCLQVDRNALSYDCSFVDAFLREQFTSHVSDIIRKYIIYKNLTQDEIGSQKLIKYAKASKDSLDSCLLYTYVNHNLNLGINSNSVFHTIQQFYKIPLHIIPINLLAYTTHIDLLFICKLIKIKGNDIISKLLNLLSMTLTSTNDNCNLLNNKNSNCFKLIDSLTTNAVYTSSLSRILLLCLINHESIHLDVILNKMEYLLNSGVDKQTIVDSLTNQFPCKNEIFTKELPLTLQEYNILELLINE